MDTLSEILHRLSQGGAPQSADAAELRRIAASYPASTVAPAALVKYFADSLTPDEAASYQARIALGAGNPSDIVSAIDPALADTAHFYPPEVRSDGPDTEATIDTFLRTYGHTSPEEEALLERMIFNPVPDYAETLAREETPATHAEPGSQDALIDAFLAANPPSDDAHTAAEAPAPAPHPSKKAPAAAPPEDSLLSESLAKIFIKQGRYERAYEIISGLNLKYPKKSIYFADQMRFLQKLIKISKATASQEINE